jgi:MFS family permease
MGGIVFIDNIHAMTSKVNRVYHEYPRAFWVLIAGMFIDRLGTNLIMPFLAVYVAKTFNAGMTQVGIILTIFAISGVGGTILAGAMADKFGRRSVMIIGLVFGALSRVGLGLATSLNGLYVVAVFAGFFGTVGWPAQAAMVADMLPEHQRADGFGIQRVAANLTWVLGPMIGGVMAPITGYLLLFILDAVTSFVMAFMVFTMLPETRPERAANHPTESLGGSLAGYGLVARDGVFMAFTVISILMIAAYQQMYSALSVFLVKYQQMPESFYGALLMTNAGMVVLMQFPITRWSSKRPPLLIMVAGTALYMVGLTAYGLVTSTVVYVAAMALLSLGEMLVMPTAQALTAQLSPPDMRARYAAVLGFTWVIPQALAPLGAGLVMDNLNPNWVWYGCGILCAVGIAGFYALHLRTGDRLAAAQREFMGAPGEVAAAK